MDRDLLIISGSANPKLADDVCKNLDCCNKPASILINTFADEETNIKINDSVRGKDVFVIQPTSKPANQHIMELCLILDALKRSNCWRVTAVLPYFGYARQDRKVAPQVPISAKAVANLIEISGADRVITIDLHSGQTQGFFDIPVDNLYASSLFIKHIKSNHNPNDIVIVSPDAGGTNRAKAYAKIIGCDMAIVYKRRSGPGKIEDMTLIGDVKNKVVIMLDDMIDSSGTVCGASKIVMEAGAKLIFAYATHPVLTGTSVTKINDSCFTKVFVTDTIPLNKYAIVSEKIEVMSIAPLLASAIEGVHKETSISHLFE